MLPARPVSIGVFLTSFWPGGTERQTLELVRRLDRRRFSVHVACFHREGDWLPLVEEYADSVSEFPVSSFTSGSVLRAAGAFRSWCRERAIAVLHAGDLYANIFALPLAASAGVPVRVGSRRELNPDKTAAQLAAQRCAYVFAHKVVANSSAAVRRLRQEGVLRRAIARIANGIDLDAFHPAARPAALERLVTVARLRREKGHDTLVEAFAVVAREVPGASLTVAGDGPLRAELAERVAALGLEARVHFTGHCGDVPAALRGHGAFVLASRSEAFPNAVIEAMASGLPVVATAVGGIPELIEHGRNGILVQPGRAEELARALVDLLLRPSFARALGRKARVDVVARYSFDRMVREFESLYLAEIAARRASVRLRIESRPVTP
jgi:glycosyltransferase involved in cell wall biosynthesis